MTADDITLTVGEITITGPRVWLEVGYDANGNRGIRAIPGQQNPAPDWANDEIITPEGILKGLITNLEENSRLSGWAAIGSILLRKPFALGLALGAMNTNNYQEMESALEQAESLLRAAQEASKTPKSLGEQFKLCPGPLDSSLQTESPLMGSTYQYPNRPMTIGDQFDECECQSLDLISQRDNPLIKWECSDEAERRRDCYVNPTGPDDAPRRECLELLYEDIGALKPLFCPIYCTEVSVGGATSCSCPVFREPGRLLESIETNSCNRAMCPDDTIPQTNNINGECDCVSFDVEGEPFNLPGAP